jgi:hypothetical protein
VSPLKPAYAYPPSALPPTGNGVVGQHLGDTQVAINNMDFPNDGNETSGIVNNADVQCHSIDDGVISVDPNKQ